MPENCPFCAVDASRVVFRDELVFAIWDQFPVSDGHLLVVTTRHIADWFAALPSITSLSDREQERVAERCLAAFSVTGILSPSVLVSSGERFRQWVEKHFPGSQWHVETPICGPRSAGGNWNGTIDILLQLPSGELVVIDHKSAPIRRGYCETKAKEYAGQLAAYSEALTSAGEVIKSTWIHFPLASVLAKRL